MRNQNLHAILHEGFDRDQQVHAKPREGFDRDQQRHAKPREGLDCDQQHRAELHEGFACEQRLLVRRVWQVLGQQLPRIFFSAPKALKIQDSAALFLKICCK